jgi:hypothetical protein
MYSLERDRVHLTDKKVMNIRLDCANTIDDLCNDLIVGFRIGTRVIAGQANSRCMHNTAPAQSFDIVL